MSCFFSLPQCVWQRSRAGSESFRGHRWINPPRREECCHHLDESLVQHTVREALAKPGLTKRATCHTFRHLFATYGLNRGKRTIVVG